MLDEIVSEIEYFFWIIVIIVFGLLHCAVYNEEATWQNKYDSWTYNTDCPLPDGFSRAIIDPDKCN